MIELWVEGYAATGEHGTAQYLGSYDAESYEDAVLIWHKDNWSSRRYGTFDRQRDGKYALWGCTIYDNEHDARGGYG